MIQKKETNYFDHDLLSKFTSEINLSSKDLKKKSQLSDVSKVNFIYHHSKKLSLVQQRVSSYLLVIYSYFLDNKKFILVSGNNKAPLSINQDAFIYGGNLSTGTTLTHPIKHQAYILISDGSVKIESHILNKGDGLEVTNLSSISFTALSDAKILVIDTPK